MSERRGEIGRVAVRVHHFGRRFLVEQHRDCPCTYCRGTARGGPLHLGLNLPECQAPNAWIVVHYWRWRGTRWYLRFVRGRLFGGRAA